jgi:ribosomal-protein-alanine N-acetyltransferase
MRHSTKHAAKLAEEVRIRDAAADDLDAMLAIERSSGTAPHWEREVYASCLEAQNDQAVRRVALIAETDGRVAGFAVIRLLICGEYGEAELESIVVASAWQGRGLGRALMSSALDRVRSLGVHRLDLEVRASNREAIRLYQKAGIAETGRRRGYYREPDEDAVLMSVRL